MGDTSAEGRASSPCERASSRLTRKPPRSASGAGGFSMDERVLYDEGVLYDGGHRAAVQPPAGSVPGAVNESRQAAAGSGLPHAS
jgi:hypothetical protein